MVLTLNSGPQEILVELVDEYMSEWTNTMATC